MKPSRLSLLLRSAELALAVVLLLVGPAGASRAPIDALQRAAAYVVSGQVASGAFYGDGARADSVLEAAAAVAAAGSDNRAVQRAVDYAAARADRGFNRGGHYGRSSLALITLGLDARAFGGVDHLARIESLRDQATGAYDPNVYGHSLAMLGLLAAGATPHSSAVRYLELAQCPDGGFSAAVGCTQPSDADTTGLALNTLRLLGASPTSAPVQRAVSFLDTDQNQDGGWANKATVDSNPNSTALAIVGLISASEDIDQPRWAPQGQKPLQALLSMQGSDGEFMFSGKANTYATVQAISGLVGSAFPLPAREPISSSTPRSAESSQLGASSILEQTGGSSKHEAGSITSDVVGAGDQGSPAHKLAVKFSNPTPSTEEGGAWELLAASLLLVVAGGTAGRWWGRR